MSTVTPEHAGEMMGVKGRYYAAHRRDDGAFSTQTFKSEWRPLPKHEFVIVRAEVRYDDQCRNGQNSFSVCGTVRDSRYAGNRGEISGGQVRDEITAAFPELVPLLKWHLCDSDGPLHYVDNTLYHAGDWDCYGLRKGEARQINGGKDGLPMWTLKMVELNLTPVAKGRYSKYVSAAQRPECHAVMEYLPWMRIGEGKERQLDYARSTAVWPEATDEELCVEPAELRAALLARLPQLLVDFKAAVIGAGFEW